MTTYTSIRLVGKRALVSALQANATVISLKAQVTVGLPMKDPDDIHIWVGPARQAEDEQELVAAGRGVRRDRFILDLFFDAYKPGLTADEAEQLVIDLFGALENVIANDRTLNNLQPQGTFCNIVRYDGPLSLAHGDKQGYMASIVAEVHFQTGYLQ